MISRKAFVHSIFAQSVGRNGKNQTKLQANINQMKITFGSKSRSAEANSALDAIKIFVQFFLFDFCCKAKNYFVDFNSLFAILFH